MKKFFLTLFLLLLVTGLGLAYYAHNTVDRFLASTPTSVEEATNIIIEIKSGSNFNQVANQLYDENIITDTLLFRLYAKHMKQDTKLQAGRFEFNTGWTPKEVLEHLTTGSPVYYRLTVREGLPWWEVAKLVEKEGYATYEDFKTIIHDPEFLRHYGIPFENAEGFLYPDTYFLPKKPETLDLEAARSIAGRMVDTFWQKTKPLWQKVEPDKKIPSKKTLTRYLTLASIIEKETGIATERAKVSGVYTNRLNRDMLLQADPTVAYGKGESFKPPLLRSHLKDEKNKYNTYVYGGLPPGPIASPSMYAIEAAFNPEKHDYLYFVAKGTDGSHYFSKTLREHNNNVRKYRQTQK